MLKPIILSFTAAAFFMAALNPSHAAEQRTPVKIDDLPPKVQQTINEHVGKGKLQEIEKVVEDDEVTYEVDMRKNNRPRSFTVGDDGELLEMEVFLRETPGPVREAIQKRVGTGHIEGISKVFEDGGATFEVEYGSGPENDSENTRTFSLNDKGKLVELQVLAPETPAPVQQAIRKHSAGCTIAGITERFDDGTPEYELEIQSGTQSSIITLDEKGNLVSTEQPVSASALPAPVQKTIKDLSKDGTGHKITKTVEGDDVSYSARVRRSDHWEIVTIAPDGKIVE